MRIIKVTEELREFMLFVGDAVGTAPRVILSDPFTIFRHTGPCDFPSDSQNLHVGGLPPSCQFWLGSRAREGFAVVQAWNKWPCYWAIWLGRSCDSTSRRCLWQALWILAWFPGILKWCHVPCRRTLQSWKKLLLCWWALSIWPWDVN